MFNPPTEEDVTQLQGIIEAFRDHWFECYRPLADNCERLLAAWQAGDIPTTQREAVIVCEALHIEVMEIISFGGELT